MGGQPNTYIFVDRQIGKRIERRNKRGTNEHTDGEWDESATGHRGMNRRTDKDRDDVLLIERD